MLRQSILFFLALSLLASVDAAESSPTTKRELSEKPDVSKQSLGKPDYLLQPLDVLKIQVFPDEGLNREERVSQEFTISMPYIGSVVVKGKTAKQVQEEIRDRYDRDYLVNPQVNVFVSEYAKRMVNIVGQVMNPGVKEFPQEKGLTLVEAIALAGGQTRLANLKKVTLKRTKTDGSIQFDTINVEELMKSDSKDTWPLEPGDVITVPERSI